MGFRLAVLFVVLQFSAYAEHTGGEDARAKSSTRLSRRQVLEKTAAAFLAAPPIQEEKAVLKKVMATIDKDRKKQFEFLFKKLEDSPGDSSLADLEFTYGEVLQKTGFLRERFDLIEEVRKELEGKPKRKTWHLVVGRKFYLAYVENDGRLAVAIEGDRPSKLDLTKVFQPGDILPSGKRFSEAPQALSYTGSLEALSASPLSDDLKWNDYQLRSTLSKTFGDERYVTAKYDKPRVP